MPTAIFAILLYGFPGFIAVAITYTLIQQSEEKFFVPVLMSKTLGVNPLLVFVCMLFGATIMGVYGIILAVPIAVIFSIVFKISGAEGAEKREEQEEKKAEIKKSLPRQKTLK
jgi:predicted PurR-regulated permease PerM